MIERKNKLLYKIKCFIAKNLVNLFTWFLIINSVLAFLGGTLYSLDIAYKNYKEQVEYECKNITKKSSISFYCDKTDFWSFMRYGQNYYQMHRITTGEN